MSALKPGVLVYRAEGAGARAGVVAVGPGFLQVAPPAQNDTAHDRVLVLVDQALAAGDIDRAEAAEGSRGRREGARRLEVRARRRLPGPRDPPPVGPGAPRRRRSRRAALRRARDRQVPLLRDVPARHRGRAPARARRHAHRVAQGRPRRRLVRRAAAHGHGRVPARAHGRARAAAARRVRGARRAGALRRRARRRLARVAHGAEHAGRRRERARQPGAHALGLRGAQGQGRRRRLAARRARARGPTSTRSAPTCRSCCTSRAGRARCSSTSRASRCTAAATASP